MYRVAFLLVVSSNLFASQNISDVPVAERIGKELTTHNDKRVDHYYWMKDRNNPKVVDYLNRENQYTESFMKPYKGLQEQLYNEMTGRVVEVDQSAPYYKNGYFYYTRTFKDQNYSIYYRKKGSLSKPEKILLDEISLAKNHNYFDIGELSVSPGNTILAYSSDIVGRRKYDIRFLNIDTAKHLDHKIEDVSPSIVWSNDSKSIFYLKKDPQTLRPYQLYQYSLDSRSSKLLFEEKDPTYSVDIRKSLSNQYLFVISSSTDSTEVHYLQMDFSSNKLKLFQKRAPNILYHVYDGGDQFIIKTNYKAKNFQIMSSDLKNTSIKNWTTTVSQRKQIFIDRIQVFKSHIVILERKYGRTNFRVYNRKKNKSHYIKFDSDNLSMGFYRNAIFDTNAVLLWHESFSAPYTVYNYDLDKKVKTTISQKKVVGNFSSSNYVSKRIMAKAKDGSQIPVSLLYKKGLILNGKNPTLIKGYGSYGFSIQPSFDSNIFSLIDRGWIFAIAHVRGGSMLGQSWYDQGRLLNKKNTFTDFIDVSKFLIRKNYTNSSMLYAHGGSAGGLLMGAVMNMAPKLFNGVIAEVPFVDVVTTMLDASIPLTTGEYREWGNPEDKKYYNYMKSYSPYDNIKSQSYPNTLVITGFHDSQVQYWEPAKWVAKIRYHHVGNNAILMHTDMNSGHSGSTGRLNSIKETAFIYSFLLAMNEKTST